MQAIDKSFIFTSGNIKAPDRSYFDPATDSDKNSFFNKLFTQGHDSNIGMYFQVMNGKASKVTKVV